MYLTRLSNFFNQRYAYPPTHRTRSTQMNSCSIRMMRSLVVASQSTFCRNVIASTGDCSFKHYSTTQKTNG